VPDSFDVIIAGAGAMGSASAFHLAKRGCKVLALDRFHPPHTLGSTHGESRIIREAYFEHPLYVPLVQRAYELWDELSNIAGEKLLLQTGGLMIGPAAGVIVSGARRSAETHRLQHEMLSAPDVTRHYPAIRPKADMIAVCEPRAGVLFPERCIEAHIKAAELAGAQFKFNKVITSWKAGHAQVEITTPTGKYIAKQLVISAGSWVKELVPQMPVTVERQVLVWFKPADPGVFQPDRCPIYICEYDSHHYFYGFPDLGNGVKVALHHEGEKVNPNTANRDVSPEEIRNLRKEIDPFLPSLSTEAVNAVACLYTNMPDENFLLDRHPDFPEVLVCSPCSGHGFKFSSAIGEIVADLATNGTTRFDLTPFRWRTQA
jgi:sarcosine oxidase